eukprot:TRINITY_DN19189_c0_g1_i1.p1 TRINITY_DN19189_c0_g1~~TRINITY_DN19189_c0_g1_i1.p1  ORF type:complete len:264 (-),score=56.65 TRINITY_DN19189_c0_g1_i1:95-814(-)
MAEAQAFLEVHRLQGGAAYCILDVAILEQRNLLFTACSDGVIRGFDIHSLSLSHELRGHVRSVLCLGMDDRFLFSASSDNTIKMWDVDTLQCRCTLRGQCGDIYALLVSDRDQVFFGCQDMSVKRIDIEEVLQKSAIEQQAMLAAPFENNGEAHERRHANVELSLESLCVTVIGKHSGFVYGLARVGDDIISTGGDGCLCQWDTHGGIRMEDASPVIVESSCEGDEGEDKAAAAAGGGG